MASKKKSPSKKSNPIDYPEGASARSKKAASDRLQYLANQIDLDHWRKVWMHNHEYDQGLKDKYVNWVGIDEGGDFWSSGLERKHQQERAKKEALKYRDASQQMKQGVTKSGGYAHERVYNTALKNLREVKSAKFKGEQAIKKTGSMTRNARNKKKNAK